MEEVEFHSITKAVKSTESAQMVASIYDLLTKILLLLPVDSLIRCKTVSKHWLALINDPDFCHLRRRNPNPAIGLYLPSGKDDQSYDYISFCANRSRNPPFRKLAFGDGIRILQSCNGLLLCCSLNHIHYVYNPTTNHFRVLPGRGVSRRVTGMSLAFDPVKSPHYKVICVSFVGSNNDANSQYLIYIYSSQTGVWKLWRNPFSALVNFDNGVYWNGAIHWIGAGNGEALYFNIDRHLLDKMPMLPLQHGWNPRSSYYFDKCCDHLQFHYLSESCDHLHLIEMLPTIRFDVYEMRRDYSEWFVKYQVDLSPVVAANPEMNPFIFSVFDVIRGTEEEDVFLVLQTPGKSLRYNLASTTFECLHEFEGDEDDYYLRYPGVIGFQYIESLSCV